MIWFDRTKYSAASGCDLYNPDKSFLVWILKQYKRDIGQVATHGKTITYCNQSIMNGLVWCRYRTDGIVDDGMCGYHRLLLESPEAKAARKAIRDAEYAESERLAQEDLEITILDRLVRHRNEIVADEIHDDLNDAFDEIVRLRIRVQNLEVAARLAARKPDDGTHDADSVDAKRAEFVGVGSLERQPGEEDAADHGDHHD